MLTDLYALTNSLLRNDIKIKDEANCIKKAAKTNGFLFAFDKESIISDVEYTLGKDMFKLWRLYKNNFKRFPITNLKNPLCVIEPSELFDFITELDIVKKEKTLPDFLSYCFYKYTIHFNFNEKDLKVISTFLYTYPSTIIKQVGSKIEGTAFSDLITDLIEWFSDENSTIQDKSKYLIMYMSSMICQNVISGKIDDTTDIIPILFGRWNTKKGLFEEPKVQVGFYPTEKKNELFIDSYDKVNEAFLTVSSSKKIGTCALTGKKDQALITSKFPDIYLPVIGGTKMFVMNKDTPAQYRYDRTEAALFPISEIEANKVVNTLKVVCADEQKFRTWCPIPRPNTLKGEQDLLISWVDGVIDDSISSVIKEALPQLCITPSSKDSAPNNALSKYEAVTKNIIDAFTKVNRKVITKAKQRILILTAYDPANREVIGNFSYDLDSMLQGIKRWLASCTNNMNFRLPMKDEESGKMSIVSPYIPSPINIAILSKSKYTVAEKNETTKRSEFTARTVIGIPIGDIFNIFLKPPTNGMGLERRLLSHIYRNVVNLLVSFKTDQIISTNYYVDNDKGKATKVLEKYKKQARLDVLCSLSFFEILLDRLEGHERSSMSEESQKVGKLLGKVNELQLQYSSIVRGVKHPTKLVGATLYKVASDNPIKALARLGDDISLYYQWGISYGAGKSSYVGMLITQIKKIMTDLNVMKLEGKMTDIDKAAMLCGYMSFEASKKKDIEAEIKPEEERS